MTESTAPLPSDERALVADLVLAALEKAAPEEIDVFSRNRDGFLDGRRPETEVHDEDLAFGVELVVLLTPFVVAAAKAAIRLVADAFTESLEDEVRMTFTNWLRRVLHRQPDEEEAAAPLPAELVQRVWAVAYDVCQRMGAEDPDAGLVADAIAGRLITEQSSASPA